MPDRVRHYRAVWGHEQNAVTGLEEWGRQVLEDLWQDLEEETREFSRQPAPSWEEQERWALEEFTELRARGFVGREEIARKLQASASSPIAEWRHRAVW